MTKLFDFIPSKIKFGVPSHGPIFINSVELKPGLNEMCDALKDPYFDELVSKEAIVFRTETEQTKKPTQKDVAK